MNQKPRHGAQEEALDLQVLWASAALGAEAPGAAAVLRRAGWEAGPGKIGIFPYGS